MHAIRLGSPAWCLALTMAGILPAWSQGQESDRLDRTLERYRERLGLSTEQVEKAKAILDEARKKGEDLRRESETQIRELLTENQRTKLDEIRKGGAEGGGEGGRSGSGAGSFGSRWMGPSLEELQRELELTDAQREKVAGALQEAAESVRRRFEEAREGGFQGVDWPSLRAEAEKLVGETSERIKGELTPAQKEKFDKLAEERRNRMQSFRSRWSGGGGGEDRATPADRSARAAESLKIEDAQEREAVRLLIERVTALQSEISRFDGAARDKARDLLKSEGMAEDAIAGRLKDLRQERRALLDRLDRARAELSEVLTVKQELELVQQGVLR